MYKLLCSFLCCVLIALSAIADASDGEPNNTTPGDYQFISVYELTSMNDTTASYTARSALYYPMGRVVVAGGAYYEIENNPSYNQKKEPSRDFQYIVGIYYTNLN